MHGLVQSWPADSQRRPAQSPWPSVRVPWLVGVGDVDVGGSLVALVPGQIIGVRPGLRRCVGGLVLSLLVACPGGVPPLVLVEAGLLVVAVPIGFPARGWEIICPRIGRIGEVGGNLLPRLPARILVIGVPAEQITQPGRVRDDPDGLRHPDRPRILIPFLGQTFRHPLIQGEHHGHVPGFAAGDQGPQPRFRRGRPDFPLRGGDPFPLPVGGLIDLQHGRVQRFEERLPGQLLHPWCGLLVDLGGCGPREVGGQGGDLAGLPVMHFTGDHPLPQPGKAVADGQRVRHPRAD